MTRQLTLALVYPPFGPAGLPSLGLGLLAARLRKQGRSVHVDYWNLDYLASMPLPNKNADLDVREHAYQMLSDGRLFPLNEWIFRDAAFGDDADGAAGAFLQAEISDDQAALCQRMRRGAQAAVDRAAQRLAAFDVVGLASTFYQNVAAVALARSLKRLNPEIITILGGANADGPMGAAHLALHPQLDLAVSGEADDSLPTLMTALDGGQDGSNVPGVSGRDRAGAVWSGPTPVPIRDLDALPIPDLDDYVSQWRAAGLDQKGRLTIALESSRGCWWGERSHCTFCGLNALGMEHRKKTFSRFTDEVEVMLSRYDKPYLFMADNILAMDHLTSFSKWAETRTERVDFFYEIKSNLRRDQTEAIAGAGIATVQPGIESFSTPILKLMGKGLRAVQNIAFLRYAADSGIRPVYNILSGFPKEKEQDVHAMLNMLPQLFHLPPPTSTPMVEFHRFSPYHNKPAAFGLNLAPDPRYRIAYPFDDGALGSIAYRFVAMDQESPTYLGELGELVSAWRAGYESGGVRLVAEDVDAGIRITDTRSRAIDGVTRITHLCGFSVALLDYLDRPRSVENVIAFAQETCRADPDDAPWAAGSYIEKCARHPEANVIYLSAGDVADDAFACLQLLELAGVILRESVPNFRDLYIALTTSLVPVRQPPDLAGLRI